VASQNPALVKRNVLAGFTDVLLLPVTIVPRGIAMLNPQRWTANGRETEAPPPVDGKAVFEITAEVEDDFDDLTTPKRFSKESEKGTVTNGSRQSDDSARQQQQQQENSLSFLLSLDVVLELIHADRDALKRSETFAGYPGHYGHRVKDTIQELAVLLLQALSEQHVTPGFAQ
jgi:recyclin-1